MDSVPLAAGSRLPWEAQEGAEGIEGPVMEGPELVAAPRATLLLWLGRESPGRVEEVAAGLVSSARCCSLSLLARAWASCFAARSSASSMASNISCAVSILTLLVLRAKMIPVRKWARSAVIWPDVTRGWLR